MVQAQGKFARVNQGLPYAARVTVLVDEDPAGPRVLLERRCQSAVSEGLTEDASPDWDIDWPDVGFRWNEGAEAGVRYALRLAGQEQYCVRIVGIIGLITDTNPTIVAAAAMRAVWQAIDYTPSRAEEERIERIVFGSWRQPDKFVPDFEQE